MDAYLNLTQNEPYLFYRMVDIAHYSAENFESALQCVLSSCTCQGQLMLLLMVIRETADSNHEWEQFLKGNGSQETVESLKKVKDAALAAALGCHAKLFSTEPGKGTFTIPLPDEAPISTKEVEVCEPISGVVTAEMMEIYHQLGNPCVAQQIEVGQPLRPLLIEVLSHFKINLVKENHGHNEMILYGDHCLEMISCAILDVLKGDSSRLVKCESEQALSIIFSIEKSLVNKRKKREEEASKKTRRFCCIFVGLLVLLPVFLYLCVNTAGPIVVTHYQVGQTGSSQAALNGSEISRIDCRALDEVITLCPAEECVLKIMKLCRLRDLSDRWKDELLASLLDRDEYIILMKYMWIESRNLLML